MWPNVTSSAVHCSNRHFSQLFSSNIMLPRRPRRHRGGKYDSYSQIHIFTVLICPKHVVVLYNELDHCRRISGILLPFIACTMSALGSISTRKPDTLIFHLSGCSFLRVARSQGELGEMSTYIFCFSTFFLLSFSRSVCNHFCPRRHCEFCIWSVRH